jgi:metallophosphoesterase superfamily enzyme
VRGNHDCHAGDPPPELRIECVDEPHLEAVFVLTHHPQDSRHGYVLAGHIHPAVRLVGRARQSASLPCFWFAKGCAVLPAFGSFTGTATVDVARDDRVFVIADGRVLDVSPGRAPAPPG